VAKLLFGVPGFPMIMEYWRDDDWGKPHDVEKIQSEYHFVQEKFQIE